MASYFDQLRLTPIVILQRHLTSLAGHDLNSLHSTQVVEYESKVEHHLDDHECSHHGDVENKVKSIEIIDKEVIGVIKEALDKEEVDYRMMILPDHYTPIKLKTHTSEPVPFLIYDSTKPSGTKYKRFDELEARKSDLSFEEGYKLVDYFFGEEG